MGGSPPEYCAPQPPRRFTGTRASTFRLWKERRDMHPEAPAAPAGVSPTLPVSPPRHPPRPGPPSRTRTRSSLLRRQRHTLVGAPLSRRADEPLIPGSASTLTRATFALSEPPLAAPRAECSPTSPEAGRTRAAPSRDAPLGPERPGAAQRFKNDSPGTTRHRP